MQFAEPNVTFVRITREEAEQQLANAAPGSYLVRPSSRPGCLSLSYRNNSGLADHGRLGHLLLMQQPNGKWMCDGVSLQYRSVHSLLKRLPYQLKLDEQMQGVPHGGLGAASPAAPGYGAVPSKAQMQSNAAASGGYGKVPNAAANDDGYGRAPPPNSEYAQLSSNVIATSSGTGEYGRAPQPNQYNQAPGHADYGRVPAQNAAVNPNADYGRVPNQRADSPYACLKPTASTKNGGGSGGNNAISPGPGYGRVPNQVSAGSPRVRPRTMPPGAPAGYVGARTAEAGAAGAGAGAGAGGARRNLPVAAVSPGGAKNYGSVTVAQSGTVNAPHQLAMQALQLMHDNAPLGGHERFLRGVLGVLARAKDKAATSTPVYTALVQLGGEFAGYHAQLRELIQQSEATLPDAIMRNAVFQQHYISIQMQMRQLKSLLEHGDNFASQIHSELGQEFWQTRFGRNNAVDWGPFFQVLEETLGMKLEKVEAFVRFMFDCNQEGKVTTQSFNMFIHWFDYEGMTHPTTVKDFLLILIARAENVFFFEGFHGFCSREKAERILSNKPPKSYIIRLSDSSAGVFILSYIDSKYKTRHRLLNQVDKQGFMVEMKTYNTLPDLLAAHSSVLAFAVPNDIKFDNSADSIYGGGDALYESLAAAAMPVKKAGDPYYHAKIVLNRIWIQIRLELRETELSIQTNKAPLRRTIAMSDVAECTACAPPSGSMPCFRVTLKAPAGSGANVGPSFIFSCSDPEDWAAQITAAAADQQRVLASQSALERSVEEKLLAGIVSRQLDSADMIAELQRAFGAAQRRPGELAPFDRLFVQSLNEALRKIIARKRGKAAGVPALQFSKLDLDLQLNGSKCEVEVPVRDTVRVKNTGNGPIELRVDSIQKDLFSLKFVPNQMTLQPGQSEELHVTLVVHQTVSLQQLVHVSIGPNRGIASIFLALRVSSKMMEALKFEDIDFGPRLGSGAFGQVFHGTYRGREVAIKAVGFEPDYEQELNILRELRHHNNIVEYVGACKRQPFQGFIVLEFMSLGSLDKYIHDASFNLTFQFSMRVALDVAVGLAHLHKSKIMHLDMKPANVLVASLSPNANACVKLADFGLSQSRDTDATFRGDFVEGTLLYMAPEMLRERVFSFKGDIFSFGMTLWEMIQRKQPYSGEKHRKLKKPQFEEVRERGELPGELTEIEPPEVRMLLTKMFSFEHDERPSAEECARMIQKIRSRMP